MTELNFKCKGCKRYFDCDVGKISFPPKQERPRFEKNIICPGCGIRSMDEVELSELGQTQLGGCISHRCDGVIYLRHRLTDLHLAPSIRHFAHVQPYV